MSIANEGANSHYLGECRDCGNELEMLVSPNRNTNRHYIWIRCSECGTIGKAHKQG